MGIKNGAGKSTLLKILSRITKPTNGRIEINGRVASLLEVGTGFHPELTGRENIYLNGTILGMTKEVKSKFQEIIEFSGVEKFIDTPVKHYSSGMYVRLAFAVAAHLEPEILIIDEVLAVGDIEFQKKCLGKMKDVAENGRTVLFVSHNMTAVKSLCSSGILIEKGQIKFAGGVSETVKNYLSNQNELFHQELNLSMHNRESGIGQIRYSKIQFDKNRYQSKDDIEIKLSIEPQDHSMKFVNLKFGILINDQHGNSIYHISNIYTGEIVKEYKPGQYYSFNISKNSLSTGLYLIHIWLGANEEEQDLITEKINLEIVEGNIYNFQNSSMIVGAVQPSFKFSVENN